MIGVAPGGDGKGERGQKQEGGEQLGDHFGRQERLAVWREKVDGQGLYARFMCPALENNGRDHDWELCQRINSASAQRRIGAGIFPLQDWPDTGTSFPLLSVRAPPRFT